jgi:arylsulfatase A-like enzyme
MAATTERPNILLILTDQQRFDSLGCYGAPLCRTPHIDGLAARGVRFGAAYTSAVACSPSRAMLFTGVYPHKNGVHTNEEVLNAEIPNLATELARAGYRLGYTGKWHVDRNKVPSQYGFVGHDFPNYGYPPANGIIHGLHYHAGRIVEGGPDYTTYYADYLSAHGLEPPEMSEVRYGESPNPRIKGHEIYARLSGDIESTFEAMVAEKTVELLREFGNRQEQDGTPFFLWANFWGPHTPILLPEPYFSMYDPADVPYEPSFPEAFLHKPERQRLSDRLWGLSTEGWPGWQRIIARYWGYVTMLDDLTGRILRALRELGLEENTLVVFATDHGDMMGAHRMIEKGPYAYEASFRLPMIAAHPHCEAPGSVNQELVSLQDLYPTFIALAEGRPPPCDCTSIVDQILGREGSTGRESIYGRSGHGADLRMVRTRTHKLTLAPVGRGIIQDLARDPWELFELYDLVNDPHEMVNLIDRRGVQEVQEEMLALMRQYMAGLDDPMLDYLDQIYDSHWGTPTWQRFPLG